jgi:hypothetical protein
MGVYICFYICFLFQSGIVCLKTCFTCPGPGKGRLKHVYMAIQSTRETYHRDYNLTYISINISDWM